MKPMSSLMAALSVIATIAVAAPVLAGTAPRPLPVEKPETAERATPFRGKVDAVDATAQTLTVEGKVIYVTASTKLTKVGKPIVLSDIAVGDQVHGVGHLQPDGKTEASLVVVNPPAAGK
jgi:hypothetical protein